MASLGARMAGVMKADVKTIQEIEADPAALGQAVTVIVMAGAAALIGNIFREGVFGGITALILSLVSYAIWSLLIVLVGTKLMPEPATKANFSEAFRVIGFTAAPGVFRVFAIVPFLGPLISFVIAIWTIVIGVIAVREVLDYTSTARAIIVCLIAAVLAWIVTLFVVTPLLIGHALLG
jgi:hypothetical protein